MNKTAKVLLIILIAGLVAGIAGVVEHGWQHPGDTIGAAVWLAVAILFALAIFKRNMNTSVECASFPPDLPLTRASFYSKGGSVGNISTGMHRGYEYVAFDYDSQSGDMSHTETIVAIKTASPTTPDTNLSRASGLQLERVSEWIFAFEERRVVSRSQIAEVVDDIINLLEYAKGFPQNT